MSVDAFLDTNVFVYMLDDTDEVKRRRAGQLVRRGIETGNGCISHQVVQETLNVATKKLGFSAGDARTLLVCWSPSGRSIPAGISMRAVWRCATGTASAFTTR